MKCIEEYCSYFYVGDDNLCMLNKDDPRPVRYGCNINHHIEELEFELNKMKNMKKIIVK